MFDKKKKTLSPLEQKAKMNVVKDLRDHAAREMAGHLDSLKKVTVASDSDEGLSHGLDKAKEVLSSPELHHMLDQSEHPAGHEDELSGDENEHEHDTYEPDQAHDGAPEMDESSEYADHEDMDEDELDRKLQHLMALKERKKSLKA